MADRWALFEKLLGSTKNEGSCIEGCFLVDRMCGNRCAILFLSVLEGTGWGCKEEEASMKSSRSSVMECEKSFS